MKLIPVFNFRKVCEEIVRDYHNKSNFEKKRIAFEKTVDSLEHYLDIKLSLQEKVLILNDLDYFRNKIGYYSTPDVFITYFERFGINDSVLTSFQSAPHFKQYLRNLREETFLLPLD